MKHEPYETAESPHIPGMEPCAAALSSIPGITRIVTTCGEKLLVEGYKMVYPYRSLEGVDHIFSYRAIVGLWKGNHISKDPNVIDMLGFKL